jgi:hypothetical protein
MRIVADVIAVPSSSEFPRFDSGNLRASLEQAGIEYYRIMISFPSCRFSFLLLKEDWGNVVLGVDFTEAALGLSSTKYKKCCTSTCP